MKRIVWTRVFTICRTLTVTSISQRIGKNCVEDQVFVCRPSLPELKVTINIFTIFVLVGEMLYTSILITFIQMSPNENKISSLVLSQRSTSLNRLSSCPARFILCLWLRNITLRFILLFWLLFVVICVIFTVLLLRIAWLKRARQYAALRVQWALQSVSVCFALQTVQSASQHSFKFVFAVSGPKRSVTGFEPVTDVPPARDSRCSSACQQLEKVLINKMYLRCTLRSVSAIGCVLLAERDSIFNFCKEKQQRRSGALGSPRFNRIPWDLRT